MVARLRTRPVGIRRGDFEGRRLKRGRSLKPRMALDDGRLELGNNLVERAIKPFVIGRKNFLFSDTPRGAEASAEIYSMVATAKAGGLNPRKYLEWLLAEMPSAADPGNPAYLDSLMP